MSNAPPTQSSEAYTPSEPPDEPKCIDKVGPAWDSRRADLKVLYTPHDCDVDELRDWLSDAHQLHEFDADHDQVEEVEESDYLEYFEDDLNEDRSHYGLAFDYVEPGTFEDQDEGYWRYQISYGGPSEEIHFYATMGQHGYQTHRIEFWYLDWFDGACRTVTSDSVAQAIWDDFNECGTIDHAVTEATE